MTKKFFTKTKRGVFKIGKCELTYKEFPNKRCVKCYLYNICNHAKSADKE